jgi:membrane protein DedA with SNARE-associated domain
VPLCGAAQGRIEDQGRNAFMFDWIYSTVQWLSDVVFRSLSEQSAWAGPVLFTLAFAESMAVISLAVPFTGIIIAIGALMCAPNSAIDPWFVFFWGLAGASAGDAVSYWIGKAFKERVQRMWPFRRNPEPLERGYRFFARWGVLSVFVGRFLGPLRAVVPLVAGMMRMPEMKFQVANVASAVLWLPVLLGTGCIVGKVVGFVLADVTNIGEQVFGYVFLFFIGTSVLGALAAWIRARIKKRAAARQKIAPNPD